jgi:maleylpyruvate isomerase
VTRPSDDIDGMAGAHRRLDAALAGLDEATARRPSLLPGWSVGHLLTHIARNADSMTRRFEGAMRNEVVDQYPGGVTGREHEIDAGAARPVAALVADVRESSARCDDACSAMSDEAWPRLCRTLGGTEVPVSELPFRRWREVEVHHADLGIGLGPQDWSGPLVTRWLPEMVGALPGRADGAGLLAWLLGRAPAPELGPWA